LKWCLTRHSSQPSGKYGESVGSRILREKKGVCVNRGTIIIWYNNTSEWQCWKHGLKGVRYPGVKK
jgi:hypothetical protein